MGAAPSTAPCWPRRACWCVGRTTRWRRAASSRTPSEAGASWRLPTRRCPFRAMPRRRIPIRRADRSRRLARALTLAALVALTTPAGAHVVLDADVAQPMLAAIAADLKTTRDAPVDEGRAEAWYRSEEHTSELQSLAYLVCRLLLEKKKE